jgi:transposase
MKRISRDRAVGVDVSARQLHVSLEGEKHILTFDNDAAGHRALITAITKARRRAHVVVEATGTYHLDLAISLAGHRRCDVSVLNPRAAKAFHDAQNIRAKTDSVDAKSLCEYALRMDVALWTAPTPMVMEFRALVRYRTQLVKDQTRLKNQVHAVGVSVTTPSWLSDQLGLRLELIKTQIGAVDDELLAFENRHPEVMGHIARLMTVPGIGRVTAHGLLSDFLVLDPAMTSKQITAWAGLDPRPRQSGTSVKGRSGISKRGNARTRAAIYMSAVCASHFDGPHKDLFERVHKASGTKMVGIVAVMRKLLVNAWAMHRNRTDWDASLAAPNAKRIKNAA